jgi:hypothetical protein
MPMRNRAGGDERSLPRHSLTLELLPETYAVCRMAESPDDIGGAFVATIKSATEAMSTTVICPEANVPADVEADGGWHVIRFVGVFAFGEVGVLANVIVPLARAGMPALTVGSFETDYVLVKTTRPDRLRQVLQEAGHSFA